MLNQPPEKEAPFTLNCHSRNKQTGNELPRSKLTRYQYEV